MKALGTGGHEEIEVDGAPGHIEGRHRSMPLNEGRGKIIRWRHMGVEIFGCGRIDKVDAEVVYVTRCG